METVNADLIVLGFFAYMIFILGSIALGAWIKDKLEK